MAAGLPIVTTASGAIPEIVPDWNHLVAEGASPKMAAALVASLGPAAEALGQRNREYAARHFDRHGQGRRLGDTLRRAIGRR
jgi:glycosyltransferase involved in cell wall biosynthesis